AGGAWLWARSPLPMADRTRRAYTSSGSSAARDRSAETSSGDAGLASSAPRNVHRSVPGRQAAPHWRRALRQAREAGWTLKHLGAPHRFGVVVCPAGEHTFDVDSTARGSETKALEVPKLLRRCQHGGPTTTGSRVAERLERAQRLLDRAEQLIGIAMEDLERVEAQHAALAELDRVELLLAAADKAVGGGLAAAPGGAVGGGAGREGGPRGWSHRPDTGSCRGNSGRGSGCRAPDPPVPHGR